MDPELPELSMPDVRDWVGERSFELGRRYARDGAVLHPRREGLTLRGRCQGTAPQPYRVEVALGRGGIASADCSCPVGDGGHCKHVAALLIVWLESTEDFAESEGLDATLGSLSQAELMALLRRLVRRFPDAEDWLERALAAMGGGAAAGAPADAASIRRQVKDIVRGAAGYPGDWDEYGAAPGVGDDLDPLLERADAHLAHGSPRDAATVFLTVAATALDEYNVETDDEGELAEELGGLVARCVAGLRACLSALADPAEREAIMRGLVALGQHENAGYGFDVEEATHRAILERATPAERRLVAGLVRASLPAEGDRYSGFERRRLGAFLLELEADVLDDETYLRVCRETGQLDRLVPRLLSLGRVAEAVAEVKAVEDVSELLALVELLRVGGHGDLAENVVRQRDRASQDSRLTFWLLERAKEAGELDDALGFAEALFWREPSVHWYGEVKALAQRLGTWEKVRPGIFAHLTRDGRHALVTELYLLEGDVDQALAALSQVKPGPRSWYDDGWYAGGSPLRVRVAEAAEDARPNDAIRLYREEAERLIEAQGRDRYATAAGYLDRVRRLYARLGRRAEWDALIADVRERHRRLRALQDELRKAGM